MPMTLSSYPNADLHRLKLSFDVRPLSIWYRMAQRLVQVMMCMLWRVRVFNRRYEPSEGGVLYICNHQSFLDPPLAAFALMRPASFMARASLFRSKPMKWLIESLNAFPVRRRSADNAALKEAVRRLKAGRTLVVFPEGTRTRDGRIGKFLPGVAMLARRAATWTVPVIIDGAFECWPRSQKLPSMGSVVVQYDRPISQEQARNMTSQEFVDTVRQRLIVLQANVRHRAGRPALHYDGSPAPRRPN